MSPAKPIKSLEQLRNELALLEALSEVGETMAAMAEESTDEELNALDKHYKQLRCKLEPLEPGEETYQARSYWTIMMQIWKGLAYRQVPAADACADAFGT